MLFLSGSSGVRTDVDRVTTSEPALMLLPRATVQTGLDLLFGSGGDNRRARVGIFLIFDTLSPKGSRYSIP